MGAQPSGPIIFSEWKAQGKPPRQSSVSAFMYFGRSVLTLLVWTLIYIFYGKIDLYSKGQFTCITVTMTHHPTLWWIMNDYVNTRILVSFIVDALYCTSGYVTKEVQGRVLWCSHPHLLPGINTLCVWCLSGKDKQSATD